MSPIADLFRHERRASVFFAALTQSSLGTGAGYIALLLIAEDRFNSAWAISLVLAADLVPAMLMGPLFGALADRYSRRLCTVIADVLRAGAFVGIALVDSFAATLVLAAVAGTGTALFTPAALASLPSLVKPARLPAATSVYGAIADLGFTLGPALAALLLLAGSPETIILANGLTFGVSALVLAALSFGAAPSQAEPRSRSLAPALLQDVREGLKAAAALPGLLTVLLVSSLAFFFVGIFNVGELFLATDELSMTDAGFSALVALFGLGFISGSLSAARGGSLPELKARYLAGLALMGAGLLASGLAPVAVVAGLTFVAAGVGNGLVIVYERLLIQARVPDRLAGRVFGLKDALTAWAFGSAFAVAGALIELAGVRMAIALAGVGTLVAWITAASLLRNTWTTDAGEPLGPELDRGADALGRGAGGEDGADLVRTRDHWLALLDDIK